MLKSIKKHQKQTPFYCSDDQNELGWIGTKHTKYHADSAKTGLFKEKTKIYQDLEETGELANKKNYTSLL